MRQVVQAASGGAIELVEAPVPQITASQVLVRTEATLISAGTERAVTKLAQSSLLEKARARPDLVRQVVTKARHDGLTDTIQAVRTRLADDVPLGYSGAGTVVEVGSDVRGIRPGMRVATGGAGFANHADYQAVPYLLCAPIDPSADAARAAFSTVGSVGLHGLRQAEVGVGAKVVVVGLGLVGQLTARLAVAAGCDVAGIDINPDAVALACANGIAGLVERNADTTAAILDWSNGMGADAVIITAGSRNDSSIVGATPDRCRDRATVVAVGDIGLDLDRNEFYAKELQLRLARSYGPGRHERSYEEWGVDLPPGYVRWTEGRNIDTVASLTGSGRLAVDDLITHRFDIGDAQGAYSVLDDASKQAIGILLEYSGPDGCDSVEVPAAKRRRHRARVTAAPGVGILGAGLFVRTTVMPSLRKAGLDNVVHVASASGSTATRLAERVHIPRASTGSAALLDDDNVELIVVATPHSKHAEQIVAALESGRHVYAEKPLALTGEELQSIAGALETAPGILYTGFNRRWSAMVTETVQRLGSQGGPLLVDYRVNAGPLPPNHWYADRNEGGRLLGEVCHFVDTANAIIGVAPTQVSCVSPNSDLHDSYAVLVGYEDGSAATINYSAGASPGTPKERCEVLGRGHTLVIENYQRMTIDGEKVDVSAGKGHAEGLAQLRSAIVQGTDFDPAPAMVSTFVVLAAAQALSTGTTVKLNSERAS
ncbi:MAG: Gfo/Idh/MocA family oxidoreductase [Actinomycetia bacterium]|nr:Gfo/Idh/MocA family oxidoreductase [Actinomycetes bacterium]